MRNGVTLLLCLGLAACAQPPGATEPTRDAPAALQPGPAPVFHERNLIPDGYSGRFQLVSLVMENGDHGPQVCDWSPMMIYPGRIDCTGIVITNWTWDGFEPQSVNGDTFGGAYKLIGTFQGDKAFTLTDPPVLATKEDHDNQGDYMAKIPTPCTPPKPMIDRSKTTRPAIDAVAQRMETHPDFGGLWLDSPQPKADMTDANDPEKTVLNISFTKDLAARGAEIRQIWGGALCVTQARTPKAQLDRIVKELAVPGVGSITPDIFSGTVALRGQSWAYEKQQRELDAKYGPATVFLFGSYRPID